MSAKNLKQLPVPTPITFVLGAGASEFLGYPLGQELVDEIERGLAEEGSLIRSSLEAYLGAPGFPPPADLRGFSDALRQQRPRSIDEFLRDNEQYKEVGKVVIACALIPYERPESLAETPAGRDFWYEPLFKYMKTFACPWDNVRFVTFNYDRSLEQYLFERYSAEPLSADDKAMGGAPEFLVDPINNLISHIYGALGDIWTGTAEVARENRTTG
jgi:hypothetical protein